MEDRKASLHQGHRERMRERLLSSGGSSLADHELLEMLLFYALPRRDTNDTAHRLIEEFGSLCGVLEGDRSRLLSVEGVGDGAAVFMELLGELSRRYAAEKIRPADKIPVFDTPQKIAAFLAPRFLGLSVERAYLLLFDNGMHMLDCFHVGDGSVSGIPLSMRRIVERAVTKQAAAAVLAHNHPRGLAIPSKEDMQITSQLQAALELIEVPLIEHFVFSDRAYHPIIRSYDHPMKEGQAASSLLEILQQGAWEK